MKNVENHFRQHHQDHGDITRYEDIATRHMNIGLTLKHRTQPKIEGPHHGQTHGLAGTTLSSTFQVS